MALFWQNRLDDALSAYTALALMEGAVLAKLPDVRERLGSLLIVEDEGKEEPDA